MEAEKVIEILRLFQAVVENNENQKAFEMAIEALEKQIPKEPEKVGDFLYCPICDGFIGHVVECKEEHYQVSHCNGCGQKIDWSKDDD